MTGPVEKFYSRPCPGLAAYGLICGAMGAHTFVSTKLMLSCEHYFVDWFWYVLGVWAAMCELVMIASLNRSLVELPKSSVVIISTYYISSTIFSSVVGMSTFDLFASFDGGSAVILFVLGLLLCFLGVWIVSSGRDDGGDGDNLQNVEDQDAKRRTFSSAKTIPAEENNRDPDVLFQEPLLSGSVTSLGYATAGP